MIESAGRVTRMTNRGAQFNDTTWWVIPSEDITDRCIKGMPPIGGVPVPMIECRQPCRYEVGIYRGKRVRSVLIKTDKHVAEFAGQKRMVTILRHVGCLKSHFGDIGEAIFTAFF